MTRMTAAPVSLSNGWLFALRAWAQRVGLARKLAFVLAIAATISGVATYVVMSHTELAPDPYTVLLLLNLDLLLLLLLGAVVAWQVVRLWAERRRGSAGSRLHVRLVLFFSMLAVVPAVVVAAFSVIFFNLGIQAWFSERVQAALRESSAVAEAYLEEHRQALRADLLAMAADLNREGILLSTNARRFTQYLNAQTSLRGLSEVVLFDTRGNVLAQGGLTLALRFEVVPLWALEKARSGDLVLFNPDAEQADGSVGDRVRALILLENFGDVFLLVGRYVEPRVIAHIEKTQLAVDQYRDIEGQRSGLQVTFAVVFGMVALLLLFAAVWVGLVMANRLARPIGALIAAAERVRTGELSTRVAEGVADDELGSLARAFNRMTNQLEGQRAELIEASRQIDERRRFTEAVLSGVSSGVIGLDVEGRINLPNRQAGQLLSSDLQASIGLPFAEVVPEMAALLDAARAAPDRVAEGEIVVQRDAVKRSLLVRIGGEAVEQGRIGYVVTFDDITQLQAAQRKAAWADVARRIAHEIKNPLTPIQLSAERLRRKYMREITTDPETFRVCTETIIRQVGDIGRMVDEFSSFARMPAPVMRNDDVANLARQTVFLQRNARPEIEYVLDLPPEPVRMVFDPRQVGQALTNLLLNAYDAVQAREATAGEPLPRGRITVRVAEGADNVEVAVIDNGKGLPTEQRDRLTEPYVTTRAKGTGLGLAIVKKIMEDHGGRLDLEDAPDGGARVTLRFPRLAAAADEVSADEPKRVAAHGA